MQDSPDSDTSVSPTPNDFCTVAQAAAILGVSASTIWRWVDARRLPAFRLGPKSVRIKRADLERALRPVTEASEVQQRIEATRTRRNERPPLTDAERQRRFALFEEMGTALAEQRSSGKPLSDSTEIIRADREERSRRWW